MGRIIKAGSGIFAGAAALALSIGAIADAQQPQARPAPPTEAQIAASAAAKRLNELLEAVNSGDAAVIHAFVQANVVQGPPPPPWSAALPMVGNVLDLHRRSRGFDLVRMERITDDAAIATVRSRLTGDEQPLALKIEPQAPHRITSFTTNVAVPPTLASARSASAALPEKAKLQQIGAHLKLLSDADIFSGVVMIAREGKPVFSQAYGYADREKKIRNRIDTPFDVASIGKVFTALAIGRLAEQGKLSYEDPLSKFVPGFPDSENAEKIRIKHLLSHTSGLGGYFNQAYFEGLDRMRSAQAILEIAPREAPKFEPGTKWAYSNLGYQLLGRVIEVASGQDYFDYVEKNVFGPAGMTRASFPHFDRESVAMAQRYDMELRGSQLHYANQASKFTPRGVPDGGGIASAPDLLKLDTALRAGRVVKPETYRLHASPKPELGSPFYGYGFNMRARSGEPLLGHAGNGPGVCTDFGAVTGTPYTIVVLSNSTVTTCISVTSKILKVLAPPEAPVA